MIVTVSLSVAIKEKDDVLYLPLYFIAKAREGGYELNDKGEMYEKNPNGKLIQRRFTYEAVSQFWRCVSKIGDPVEEKPTVLKFCDWWGPLVYNYDKAVDEKRAWSEVGKYFKVELPPHDDTYLRMNPINFMSSMAEDMKLKREGGFMECEIINAKAESEGSDGKIIPHVKPGLLWIAIELAAKFVPEDYGVECKFRKEFGEARIRRNGTCPPFCLINARGGGKQWGHKCQSAYIKRRDRESTFNEGHAGVRESRTKKGRNTQ